MKAWRCLISLIIGLSITSLCYAEFSNNNEKKKILVISSYHREYLWSKDTNAGLCAAMLKYGYFENEDQINDYTKMDSVETSKAIVSKLWMDTKRKSDRHEISKTLVKIIDQVKRFNPDLIMLGDDNAVKYVGSHFIDTGIPVVFWGVNGNPLKYDLIDSLAKPGHNITGIYQAGYLKECVINLKKLVPSIKRFAILSDDSPSGRAKTKELISLGEEGKLPIEIIDAVTTNSFSEWKAMALSLNRKVDAFFILNHNTLKDKEQKSVDQLEIGAWYLRNIKKPDASHEKQFVIEGILSCVDDSGFKQGYEAVKIVDQILEEGKKPADIPVYAPEKGPFIVNRERAKDLGIMHLIDNNPLIEAHIDESLALKKYSK